MALWGIYKLFIFLLFVVLEFFHWRSDAEKEVRTELAVQQTYSVTASLGETSQTSAAPEKNIEQLVNSISTRC